jgi:hypothetical protein
MGGGTITKALIFLLSNYKKILWKLLIYFFIERKMGKKKKMEGILERDSHHSGIHVFIHTLIHNLFQIIFQL